MNNLEKNWAKKPGEEIARREIADTLGEHYYGRKEDDEKNQMIADDEDSQEYGQEQEIIPNGLMSTEDFLDKFGWDAVEDDYNSYAEAMERKLQSHGRVALEDERFYRHFFEGGSSETSLMYGDQEKGYLLGALKFGVFTPTHFAPKSLRKGYDLMKELGQNKDVPAVLAITEDLIETLKKMPEWQVVDTKFIEHFMDQQVEKQFAHNGHPKVSQLFYGLMYEYFNDREIK